MVDDIASDSDSTSTTNDSEASDKCESPLVAPVSTEAQMLQIFEKSIEKSFDKFYARMDESWNEER